MTNFLYKTIISSLPPDCLKATKKSKINHDAPLTDPRFLLQVTSQLRKCMDITDEDTLLHEKEKNPEVKQSFHRSKHLLFLLLFLLLLLLLSAG